MRCALLSLCLVAACPGKRGGASSSGETAETADACPSTALWYPDADGDGYGAGADPVEACAAPEGYLADAGDCDDADPDVHPGAAETCDGVDDDCDGLIDEGQTADGAVYHVDGDGDGHGDPDQTLRACAPADGWTEDGTDCDDSDASTYPGAPERCGDGVANGCGAPEPGCDWTGSRSLDAASAELVGVATEDHAGGAVAGVGDTDGDGVSDLAVGAFRAGGGSAGAAYLVRGPVGGVLDLSASAGLIAGEEGDAAGASVSGAGDVDGDGLADLLVGAYGAGEGGEGALFFGPVAGGLALGDADALLIPASDGQIGAAAAGGADADGDGLPDLLLGAPGGAGGAWLVPGAALSDPVALLGAGEDSGAGLAVAFVGDADGDGLADLAVGAPYAGAGRGGAAYLILAPASASEALADADRVLPGADLDYAGRSVAGVDADGDGDADLLVGATGVDTAGESAGAAYLLRGPPAGWRGLDDADAIVLGEAAGDGAGFTVAATGDLDGDGGSTWAVGATGEDTGGAFAGAVYVLRGAPEGTRSLAEADAKFSGVAAGDSAGVGLAGAGDLDRDGRDDLLVGAWGVDAGGSWAGAALLVPGGGY